ncbi:site-specific integrase [Mesorhizobium huakuii]|uniref:site-specific integrase n=1 Tax=Mesorhizobium huakuii TaxID=28104 RepID=UPI003D7B3DA7
MLKLAVSGYIGRGRLHKPDNPFERQAPGLLKYLTEEKGLRQRSIDQYQFSLRQFATYLERIGIGDLANLSPTVLSGFIADYAPPEFPGRRSAMHAGCYGSSCATSIDRGFWPRTSVRLSSFRSRIGTLVFRDRSVGNRSSKCWQASTDGPPPASATTQ